MGTWNVTIYGRAVATRFTKHYPASRKPLARFLDIASAALWTSLVDVKQSFPAVDYAPKTGTLIFDIGGNKYRLIALVNFADHELDIQNVLTHEQYDREDL